MSNADDTIAADIMAVEAIIFHVTPSYRKSLSVLRSAPLHPGKEEVSSTFPHTRAEVRRADALHRTVMTLFDPPVTVMGHDRFAQ